MLLDVALHVVVNISANHQSVLSLTIHGLRINIIMFARILNQPSLVLELLEVLSSLLVHTWIVLRCAYREVNLGLDDVIQTHLVIASFGASFFRIEYVVWT